MIKFNEELYINLRKVLTEDYVLLENRNCAKMYIYSTLLDRLEESVNFLNKNLRFSKDANWFYLFMLHSCNIISGVHILGEDIKNNINDKINLEEKLMYFKNLKVSFEDSNDRYNKIKFSYDKEFFNFLRSTSFAHPFQTNGAYGNKLEEEVFYCPYITLDDEKCINLIIYSTIRGIISINFKFKELKDYVLFNYNKLEEYANYYKDKYNKITSKKHKINRLLSFEDKLSNIIEILDKSHQDSFDLKNLKCYYLCQNTCEENKLVVQKYKKDIENKIDDMCSLTEKRDFSNLNTLVNSFISCRPYNNGEYHRQLEKIYSNLCEERDEQIINSARKIVEEFSKGFARNWVIIKPYEMTCDEIKMLVTIACYYEKMQVNNEMTEKE